MDGAFLQETHQQVRHVLEPLLQLEKTLRKITEASQSTSFDWHGDLWKDEELNGVLHDMPGPVGQADSPTSHKSSKGFLEENAVQAGEGTGTPLHELMRMSEASSLSHASLSSANGTSTRARVRISDSDGHSLGLSPSDQEFTKTNIHDVWRAEPDSLRSRRKTADRGSVNTINSRSLSRLVRRHDFSHHGLSRLVMRPDSFLLVVWDIICGMTMLHDSVMIPLLTAFDVQHGSGILYGFALVSAVIWCLDMNISFFRGFINARTGWTTRDSVRTLVREIDRAQRGNVFIPKAYK
ncbi:Potassium channel AKT2, partial [Durusdinium trenchii]